MSERPDPNIDEPQEPITYRYQPGDEHRPVPDIVVGPEPTYTPEPGDDERPTFEVKWGEPADKEPGDDSEGPDVPEVPDDPDTFIARVKPKQ